MAQITTITGVKKNVAFAFNTGLVATSNPTILQASPTIALGDVKISQDEGAFANLSNLPSAVPSLGKQVRVQLTQTEMNADRIGVLFVDQTSPPSNEWEDQLVVILTTDRDLDDLAYTTYQLPDSIPADGTRPNIEQALYMIVQFLNERVVAGTTVTVKKVDGSTTLMTFTLNDALTPTSITRTT